MMGMIYTLFADHEDDDDYVEDYDALRPCDTRKGDWILRHPVDSVFALE